MMTFSRFVFFLCCFNVVMDFITIANPNVKQSEKQVAAIFGMINALCIRVMYDKAWPEKDKKKPPQA